LHTKFFEGRGLGWKRVKILALVGEKIFLCECPDGQTPMRNQAQNLKMLNEDVEYCATQIHLDEVAQINFLLKISILKSRKWP